MNDVVDTRLLAGVSVDLSLGQIKKKFSVKRQEKINAATVDLLKAHRRMALDADVEPDPLLIRHFDRSIRYVKGGGSLAWDRC